MAEEKYVEFGSVLKQTSTNHTLVDSTYIRGGYFVIDTLTSIDAKWAGENGVIKRGSLCYNATDSKMYQYDGTSPYAVSGWKELIYTRSEIDTLLAAKQDKLPTVVNDKYLHTNATTGALEWADAGSDDFQVVETLPASPTSESAKVVYNLADNRLYILSGSDSKYSPITDQGQTDYTILNS